MGKPEDNREGRMPPPPPPPPRFRMPHGKLRASQPPRSRTREASSAVEDDDDVVEVVQPGSSAAASRSQGPAPAKASSSKRRRNESPRAHSPGRRMGGIDGGKSLFGRTLMTPAASQLQRQGDADHDVRHGSPLARDRNDDFDDEDEVRLAKGLRLSLEPSEHRRLEDLGISVEDDETFGH